MNPSCRLQKHTSHPFPQICSMEAVTMSTNSSTYEYALRIIQNNLLNTHGIMPALDNGNLATTDYELTSTGRHWWSVLLKWVFQQVTNWMQTQENIDASWQLHISMLASCWVPRWEVRIHWVDRQEAVTPMEMKRWTPNHWAMVNQCFNHQCTSTQSSWKLP